MDAFLSVNATVFALILCRVGGIMAIAPALGETSIPARVRASFAFALAIILYPASAQIYGTIPATLIPFAAVIAQEIFIGLFIGLIGRLVLSALNTAGTIIAMQTGLAAAQSFDPAQGAQGALVGRFLTVIAVTLIFVSDLHHILIEAVAGSYKVLPPQGAIPIGDASKLVIHQVTHSFALALQLSAPFLAYGMLFNISMGLIARLMPQLQIFFIAMPANIMAGLSLFIFTLSGLMLLFLGQYEDAMRSFLNGG